MSNDVMVVVNELIGDDFDKQQLIINQVLSRQNEILNKKLREMSDRVDKVEETQVQENEKTNQLREMELKRHRVTEDRFGYVSLNDLGQKFEVSIGSKTMGQLLRLVGLAKTKQSKTEPYRQSTVDDYAKSILYGNFPTYQWNPERCIKRIDRWLTDNGYIEKFYLITDEEELMRFIQDLAKEFGV